MYSLQLTIDNDSSHVIELINTGNCKLWRNLYCVMTRWTLHRCSKIGCNSSFEFINIKITKPEATLKLIGDVRCFNDTFVWLVLQLIFHWTSAMTIEVCTSCIVNFEVIDLCFFTDIKN